MPLFNFLRKSSNHTSSGKKLSTFDVDSECEASPKPVKEVSLDDLIRFDTDQIPDPHEIDKALAELDPNEGLEPGDLIKDEFIEMFDEEEDNACRNDE